MALPSYEQEKWLNYIADRLASIEIEDTESSFIAAGRIAELNALAEFVRGSKTQSEPPAAPPVEPGEFI